MLTRSVLVLDKDDMETYKDGFVLVSLASPYGKTCGKEEDKKESKDEEAKKEKFAAPSRKPKEEGKNEDVPRKRDQKAARKKHRGVSYDSPFDANNVPPA